MAARDFKPISLLAKVPSLYVMHPDVRAKNLKEFVALAGSKPGQLNDGSAGNDSAGHLTFKYLKIATGIFILHASYRGTDPPLTDLLVGRLQAAAVGAPAILQFVKAGKLRCIATSSVQRIAALPEMTQWYGLPAPAPAPATLPAAAAAAAAADKLAVAAARAVREPTALERLSGDAALAVGSTPAEVTAFIAKERERRKLVIARAKVKPD